MQRFFYGDAPGPVRDLGKGDAPLRVYRRTDIAAVRIVLDEGDAPVICDVAHTTCIFSTMWTPSSLPLSSVQPICRSPRCNEIMYRFGRAYPPAGRRPASRCIARSVSIGWMKRQRARSSDYDNRERYLEFVGHQRTPCFAAHWEFLLKPLRAEKPTQEPVEFRQIEYYRMPVMTYLTLDRMLDIKRTDFMRLAFADGSSANGDAPYAERFLHDFEGRNCYDRFFHEGSEMTAPTRASCCRGMPSPSSPTPLQGSKTTNAGCSASSGTYFLLFLISHFHKAALLMLSDRLVAATKQLEVRSAQSAASFRRDTYHLQEAFMLFTQRYWFTEVSDQAQTRDLFRMQRMHLGNDDLYKELRNEIFDMVQYLDSDILRRQSGTIHRLTAVTIAGLIGTIATGFLGMNSLRKRTRRCSRSWATSASCRCGGLDVRSQSFVLAAADGAPRPYVRRATLGAMLAHVAQRLRKDWFRSH